MVYLPTWMVDFLWFSCRVNIPVPWDAMGTIILDDYVIYVSYGPRNGRGSRALILWEASSFGTVWVKGAKGRYWIQDAV